MLSVLCVAGYLPNFPDLSKWSPPLVIETKRPVTNTTLTIWSILTHNLFNLFWKCVSAVSYWKVWILHKFTEYIPPLIKISQFLGWIKSPSWQEFESIVVKYFRLVEVARFPNGQRLREDKSQNLSLGSGALRKSLRIEITSQGLIRKGLWYDYQLCQMSEMSRWLSDVKYGRYDCQINHETSVRRLWENLWGSRIWFIRHIACVSIS